MIWFDNMKKLKKSILLINTITFIFYVYSSILSLITVLDEFFYRLLGISTDFRSVFLYSYEARKKPYANNMRLNGLMQKYYDYHWQFIVHHKYFYPVFSAILILSVIGLFINFCTKDDNKHRFFKSLILILIIIITILITISNIYYLGWYESYLDSGI